MPVMDSTIHHNASTMEVIAAQEGMKNANFVLEILVFVILQDCTSVKVNAKLDLKKLFYVDNLIGTCPRADNGLCDGENNIPECNYDDGDCCLYQGLDDCFWCKENGCICHETDQKHCSDSFP